MLLEDLPSELLLEIFSYIHPCDLYNSFLLLSKARLSKLISQLTLSLDLTYTSYSRFLLILKYCSPSQIVYLRLTNQYSHSLLIGEFFSSERFRPEKFLRLRSLYLDDIIGNEIDYLPPALEKLHIKFHKKAKYALKFYQLALRSTSLKQCYLIGGYAFDHATCTNISSPTIEQLHMAVKSFPNDLLVLLQAIPHLTKLKTCVYNRTSASHQLFSSFSFPLTHLNIDLQDSGVTLNSLNSLLLCHLPDLQSLTYHSYGKAIVDIDDLTQLTSRLQQFQFIQKGLSININIPQYHYNRDFVVAVQEITNKNPRRLVTLHSAPYQDRVLNLPFAQWNRVQNLTNTQKHISNEEIYDRVERVRINLSECSIDSNSPTCRHVKHLTLTSNNENQKCCISPAVISSFMCLSSVRHLIVNTQTSLFDFNQLIRSMSLHSLDIAWSHIRSDFLLSNIKALSLIGECVSWKEIKYLIERLIPHLEHLQMNVTTSDECRRILDFLLSPRYQNDLISIKICICQTLSDQIREDLEPILLSSQWIKVKWKMDNWYLYIWK